MRKALSKFETDRNLAGGVDIIFIDDGEIAKLAGRYRKSPYPTDVLAFAGKAGFPLVGSLAGEIAISLDTAGSQARERGIEIEEELILLCVHGLFHIEGQRDETHKDWCAMRIKEFEALVRIL